MSVRGIRKLEGGLVARPRRSSLEALAEGLGLSDQDRQRFVDRQRGIPASPSVAGARTQLVPRQLPPAPPQLVGRQAETCELDRLLLSPDFDPPAAIFTIAGTAGIGKTALATWWAHRAADRFPDGQLFANLRGFDASADPASPTDVLHGFLIALGERPENITPSFEERVGLYRTLLADRRVLVVLDNARDVQQVRPLLTAGPGSATIVTSRNRLAGLVAEHGAHPLSLDLLSNEAAVELLHSRLGHQPSYQPEQLAELGEHCARLPLALVVAAARLAITSDSSLESVIENLTHRHSKLDTLQTGDPHTSARNVFSWSYQHLSPTAARTFRLLGLHPGTDVDVFAAAALTDCPTSQAQDALEALTRAHLIHEDADGRYAMHDLLWTWAAECAADDETAHDRAAALARLLAVYRHTAGMAVTLCTPRARAQVPDIPTPTTAGPRVDDSSQASAWLAVERHNLIAVAIHAAENGNPSYATELAAMLFSYLWLTGMDTEAVHLHEVAAESAVGPSRAAAMLRLGTSQEVLGHSSEATITLEEALRLSRDFDDRDTEVRVFQTLGMLAKRTGRFGDCLTYYRRALDVAETLDNRVREGVVRNDLGGHLVLLGRNEEALPHLRLALDLARDGGDPHGQCAARTNFAELHRRLGDDDTARDQLSQALSLARDVDYREAAIQILSSLATIEARAGEQQRALQHHHEAIESARETGRQGLEVLSLIDCGNTLRRIGRPDEALTCHQDALQLLGPSVGQLQFAELHESLGDDYSHLGDKDRASAHWQRALAVYSRLGVPEAHTVQARLSDLGARLVTGAKHGDHDRR